MFSLDISALEIIARTLIVYAAFSSFCASPANASSAR